MPGTMEWDMDYNKTKKYIIKVIAKDGTYKWLKLSDAISAGMTINFNGQELTISIPKNINVKGQTINSLDSRTIEFRLMAKVKDEVMLDKTIETVSNSSEIDMENLNWLVPPKDKTATVKISRQGGWISGVRPGEVKIIKVLKGTNKPVKGVEFTLTKSDGSNIEIKKPDVTYESKGKSITLVTDENGKAGIKGLAPGSYILKETNAPKWLEFDNTQPIKKEFTITKDDKEGFQYSIENSKKKIKIKVEKKWKSVINQELQDFPETKVRLYRNNQPILDEAVLSAGNLSKEWTDLDFADDDGKPYEYTVKEVGESGNSIKLNDKWYKVGYEGNQTDGFSITNKEEMPWGPMIPPTRNLDVTKVWKLAPGTDIPVEKIEVELFKNGIATGQKLELKASENWKGQFKNLPVSETLGGEKYEYTVKEVGESDKLMRLNEKSYNVSYEGNMQAGITVVNEENVPPAPPENPESPPKTDKPKTPDKPETPDKSKVSHSSATKERAPETGDDSSVVTYLELLALSGCMLLLLGFTHKKRRCIKK